MDPRTLERLQLALERKGLDADGCLVRTPGPEPDDIPRVYVVRLAGTPPTVHLRHDVPAPVRERILALGAESASVDHEAVRAILADHRPCAEWDEGRSYVLDEGPPVPPDVVRLGVDDRELLLQGPDAGMADIVRRRPVYAVVEDGRIASAAVSVREHDDAAEAWVITDGHHRRRGLATRVVAAWAADVIAAGKVAFYSHSTANHASAGVARNLGARPWKELVAYA